MRFLLAFFLLASTVNAGPLDWAKHHKRFLLMEGAALAGAGIDAAGIHHCRKYSGSVENCQSHYGPAWATFGIDAGFTTIVMPSLAEACWKDSGGKFCYGLAYGATAWQTTWGLHEYKIKFKKENDSQ